ncbi:MAG: helix-turn-helix domain-containing protein [Desulfamplus sp.]|nr:helix-turn-helix domain-containing protein [Desulfamplus sp.]
MSNEKLLDVIKIIERAKECLKIKTNTELANRLNLKQNTISAWKKRGNIDLTAVITLCATAGVSIDWLLYGKGECGLVEQVDKNDPKYKIVEMLDTMTEEQKRDVLKYAEKEKLFEELIKSKKSA